MRNKIKSNDKIFIAGASGMVGSSIIRLFKKNGFQKNLLIPTRNELNLLDLSSVREWFNSNRPNIVILAAARVGGILANSKYPANFILENLKIQTNIIESAWHYGAKRLLFLGSSCIYPKYANQPIKEEYLLSDHLETTNEYYAIAKIAGIKLCESLRIQYGFDAISLMPTNLYGPNDNYHPEDSHVMASLIIKFLNAKSLNLNEVNCWGSGNALREFMYVDDLAEAVFFCLNNWHPGFKNSPLDEKGNFLNHLNVGTGKDISIRDLATKIAKITEFNGEIIWDTTKPDGTPKKQLDVKKIKELGWEAKIDLDVGIKRTIEELNSTFPPNS